MIPMAANSIMILGRGNLLFILSKEACTHMLFPEVVWQLYLFLWLHQMIIYLSVYSWTIGHLAFRVQRYLKSGSAVASCVRKTSRTLSS
ncbi:hypothetical protein SCA6_016990 [Theobroma cacao]